MRTEIQYVDPSSVFRIALPLGVVNGFIVAFPIIREWLDAGVWITGYPLGPGMFVFGLLIVVGMSAVTTAIVTTVLAVVYNAVASRLGGIEIRLSN